MQPSLECLLARPDVGVAEIPPQDLYLVYLALAVSEICGLRGPEMLSKAFLAQVGRAERNGCIGQSASSLEGRPSCAGKSNREGYSQHVVEKSAVLVRVGQDFLGAVCREDHVERFALPGWVGTVNDLSRARNPSCSGIRGRSGGVEEGWTGEELHERGRAMLKHRGESRAERTRIVRIAIEELVIRNLRSTSVHHSFRGRRIPRRHA